MNKEEEFIQSLYDDAAEQMKEIYKQQNENKGELLKELAMILLSYTIIDNILALNSKEKSENYSKLSVLITSMFGKEIETTTTSMEKVLKNTSEEVHEFLGLKSTNIDVQKIIDKNYKGLHFSERVWTNENEVSKMLHKEVNEFLKGNINANQIKSHIEKQFGANKYNTKRLVDDQVARIQSEATEKYLKLNDIKKVTYVATLCNTCDKCMQYHNKKFDVDDPGRPILPQHVQCHCFYVQAD